MSSNSKQKIVLYYDNQRNPEETRLDLVIIVSDDGISPLVTGEPAGAPLINIDYL